MATPVFLLNPPIRSVIHKVGAVRHGGPVTLTSCYRRGDAVADEVGARAVAFPAIATGVCGYPPEPAAHIAGDAPHATSTRVERMVRVAFFDTAERRPRASPAERS